MHHQIGSPVKLLLELYNKRKSDTDVYKQSAFDERRQGHFASR
jgi:hypothetical protein